MTFRVNGEFSFIFGPCLEPDSTSPNRDCQMIFSTVFRTEEEKVNFDLFRRAMNNFPTASTTTRTILPSNPHLEDLCDEPEDSPGRLKRVNIRHSSV